jgi:hypothetical protein
LVMAAQRKAQARCLCHPKVPQCRRSAKIMQLFTLRSSLFRPPAQFK